MSKRSRTFQPSDPRAPRPDEDGQPASDQPVAPVTPTTSAEPAKSAPGSSSRAEARRRTTVPKAAAQQSFFDRYRILILGGAGVVVVLVGLLFFTRSATQAYECVTFLTPPPAAPAGGGAPADPSEAPAGSAPSDDPATASPAATPATPASPAASAAPDASAAPSPSPALTPSPAPTPLLGFQTADMSKNHVVQGATVKYAYCPPASGQHYNLGGGQAPLARRFFGPTDNVIPPQWIHNLEHGYVVLLYRGDPGAEVLDGLRSIMDEAIVTDWSLQACGPVNKVIALRFDDMDPGVDFAAVAWDRVLLLGEFDRDLLLAFANQWQDGPQTPERVCS